MKEKIKDLLLQVCVKEEEITDYRIDAIKEMVEEFDVSDEDLSRFVWEFIAVDGPECIGLIHNILGVMADKYTDGSKKKYYETFRHNVVEALKDGPCELKERHYQELFVEYLFSLVVHSNLEGAEFLDKSILPVKSR